MDNFWFRNKKVATDASSIITLENFWEWKKEINNNINNLSTFRVEYRRLLQEYMHCSKQFKKAM